MRIVLMAFAGLLLCCTAKEPALNPKQLAAYTGKVIGVSDGDTITVLRDGKGEKVRLFGIDCPERRQAFGTKARQFTADLAFGRMVTVEAKTADRYHRTVAVVKLEDGRDLGATLIEAGLAWWSPKYAPRATEYRRLEQQARLEKRGLWSDPKPVAPHLYRRSQSKTRASGY